MKKALLLTLFAGLAYGAGLRHFTETQTAAARAAPTAATDGMSLLGVDSFRVSVCAPSAQTLGGAGSLHAYLFDVNDGLWKRNPSLDLPISVTATSCASAACRCQQFPDQKVGVGDEAARVLYAASGVTLSGGTDVTVSIHASLR